MSEIKKMHRTKVKVCGMTRAQDVRAAVDLGVDAIGVILHANSPRLISIEAAQAIRAEIPAFVTMVGVFVDLEPKEINDMIVQTGIDLVQLHGKETNAQGNALTRPFIKAVRARDQAQVTHDIQQYDDAKALLLDPYIKGQHGGTGQQLNSELWPQKSDKKLILAGGLSPDNVGAAVSRLKPFAVDLNSGVETAPGIKSIDLIQAALDALGH